MDEIGDSPAEMTAPILETSGLQDGTSVPLYEFGDSPAGATALPGERSDSTMET